MPTTDTLSVGTNALPEDHVAALAAIEEGYWWFSGRVHWAERLMRAAIQTQGKLASRMTYLDLGCGTGGFAKEIDDRLRFKTVVLVDGDPKVLKIAARYPHFEIQHQDLNQKVGCAGTADIVSCMDVIEHLPHDADFLKQLFENMRTGSDLILSVPAYPAFYSEWDRKLGHYRRYTPKQLKRILLDAGFSIQFLSPMWSFLAPMAPIRRMKAQRYQEGMEFEKVPHSINELLVGLSRLEWGWARRFPLPFGTSLITWVKK